MQVVINFVITVKPSITFQFQTFSESSKQRRKNRQVEWFIMRSFWKNLPEVVSNSRHFSLADRNIKLQLGLHIKLPVNYNRQITGR